MFVVCILWDIFIYVHVGCSFLMGTILQRNISFWCRFLWRPISTFRLLWQRKRALWLKFREGRTMSAVVPQTALQTADLTSSVFSCDNPDLAWCLVFSGTDYFHTLPLWEEQRLVRDALCQGPKRGRPKTSRRPLCEKKRMGRGRKRNCLALRVGGVHAEAEEEGGRGLKGEATSDDCHAASECQRPEIVASSERTEDTEQTAALRSSKHRPARPTRQTVKSSSVFRCR